MDPLSTGYCSLFTESIAVRTGSRFEQAQDVRHKMFRRRGLRTIIESSICFIVDWVTVQADPDSRPGAWTLTPSFSTRFQYGNPPGQQAWVLFRWWSLLKC
jgi:hypothetical protein